MRADMAKVIVERPRLGRGFRYPRGQVPGHGRLAPEHWNRREGIRRPWIHWGKQKSLNENLAPLCRFLRSHLGEPWDDVYGEICQRINRNSAVQLHIWQHLVGYVCTDPHKVLGDVGRWPWGGRDEFYVDPATGLLCESLPHNTKRQRRRDRRPVGPPDRVRVDARREYRRIDGIWYELTLERIPVGIDRVPDVCLRKRCYPAPADVAHDFHGRWVYAVAKRQLNKREIRRLREVAADGSRG